MTPDPHTELSGRAATGAGADADALRALEQALGLDEPLGEHVLHGLRQEGYALVAASPAGTPEQPDLLETVRLALNDYDHFVAMREEDGRVVTLKDRHDWAERWVARLPRRSPVSEQQGGPTDG